MNKPMVHGFPKLRLFSQIALAFVMTSSGLLAAPYFGEEAFTYQQPDGETFQVRLYGDEFFAYEETEDGYLVIRDPNNGNMCYAKVTPDGTDIVSTGVRVGQPKPAGLKPKQRLGPGIAMVKSIPNRNLLGADEKGRRNRGKKLKVGKGREILNVPIDETTPQSAPADGSTSGTNPVALPAPPPAPTLNQRIGLVLLASFPDRPADITKTVSQIDDYCNAETYTADGNATSVYGYFKMQSNGKLTYKNCVTAWFTAANPRSYYTDSAIGYGTRATELINEGLTVLKAQGFDFTQCDGNNDGKLDGINCFYAGARVNGWSQGLWPHQSSSTWNGLSGTGLTTTFFDYQITDMPASLAIGTFCHENGHMICDFPDLYSYNGNAADINNFSLMASSGSTHPVSVDPYLKIHAGWADVVDLTSASHQLCAVQQDRNFFYRYKNPAKATEYFIFEVRGNAGYEGVWNGATASNPANGLVVYHALQGGSNTSSTIFTADAVTNYTKPYELLVLEATPNANVPWYDGPYPTSNDAFSAAGVSSISESTTPDLKFWAADGRTVASGADIHTISAAGQAMTFIAGAGALPASPVTNVTATQFQPNVDFGKNAANHTFSVFNGGGGTVSYNITDDADWLACATASGTATMEADLITVSYTTAGLAAGTHTATITINGGSAGTKTIGVTLTVNPRPTLASSVSSYSVAGVAGSVGPSASFHVSNTGGGTCAYTIANTKPWLTLDRASGTVSSELDLVTVNFNATALAKGVHTDTITITSAEATNSPLTIPVTFTVDGADMILSSPNGGESWVRGTTQNITWASGIGGNVKIELLKNSVVNTTISASTPNDGSYSWTIPAGQAIGSNYRMRITSVETPTANDLSFTDFAISAPATAFYTAAMDTNPGWTLEGAWAWGKPAGVDGDPLIGYTGNNVIGFNLSGKYANSLPETHATTPVIDCTYRRKVQLSFYRWLGSESGYYDKAYVRVSNDNINWINVFAHDTSANATIQETAWSLQTYDISAIADGAATVYVRWTMGTTDGSINYSGWNIDDVVLTGEQTGSANAVVVTQSGGTTSVTEGGATDTYTLQLSNQPTANVTVNITPDSQVGVTPTSVTFTSVNWATPQTVTVNAVNDTNIEPTHTGTINHSATSGDPNYNGINIDGFSVTVTDNDNTPPTVNAGTDQAVVLTGSIWLPSDLPVQPLAWHDATDPSTVVLAAGAVSQWSDKTTTGAHLVQGTTANRPATGTTINGRNSISFDGTNDGLKSATNPFGTTINNAFMAAVVNLGSINTASTMFSLTGSSANANRWQAHVPWTDGSLYFDCGGGAAPNRINGASGFAANQNKLLGFYSSVDAATQEVWADGTRILNDATGHPVTTSSGISFGFDGTTGNDQVRFGESIIINGAITAANRQKLEGYLAHKWALRDALPADHPHKTLTPSHSTVVAALNGTVTDVNPQTLTTTWSMVSGPAAVTFANASSIDTNATFTVAGTYVLRLSANDGFDTSLDEVTVTVNANTYPVTYNANSAASGTAPASQSKIQDTPLTLASNSGNLARPGYTYGGWNTAADGSGVDYGAGASYAANAALSLYTKWNVIAFPITQSGDTTVVAENAGTDSFTVALNTAPTSDVVISVTSNNTAEATVSVATLTFTPLNWATPQTVTVTAVNDSIDRNDSTTITLSIVDASSDDIYDPVPDQTIAVTCTDDDVAGFTVTQSSGTTVVAESATTDTFTVKLNSQPLSDVVISVISNNTAEATVSPATLTFTSANWSTTQTVTVTPVDDFIDRNDSTSLTLSIVDASSDNTYDPVADQSVAVTCTDNDTLGFTYAHTGSNTTVAENGGPDTFTVKLNSQPLSDVVISVTSNSTADATVSPATLTFTPANWSTTQTVTVTGVNDFFDRNDSTTITLSVVDASSEDTYDLLADQSVAVTCTDDDAVGFTITQSGGNTTVPENGGTDSFTVRLNAQPASNVVINVSNGSPADATVSVTSLTFTPANWSIDQTVTATGVNDDIDRNDTSVVTLSIDAANSDNTYDLLANQTVTVTCTDDDTAGVAVVQSGGTTVVAENAGTDTFTVALSSQPLGDVVINVVSSSTADATVSPAILTFTSVNWATPQTVTVTAVNDNIDRNDSSTITLLTDDTATVDATYDPLAGASVTATCTDDDTAGFAIAQSGGNTVVAESAGTDTFTVVLNSEPTSNVVISVTSGSTADATVSPASLTFTTANWNVAQTVTVTGVNDNIDRNDGATITLSVVDGSSDNTFDPLLDQTVAVTCTDDDTAGFTITEVGGTIVAEAGGTDTFTVKLNSQPLSNVVISVVSASTVDATVSAASLTFTSANWATAQTITVTGVNDNIDRNDSTTITLGITDASSDDTFDPLPDQTVAVTCTDDDTAGFTIAEVGGTIVAEAGGTDTFTVKLNSQPLSDVVISVASNGTSEATVNVSTLTFTSANWSTTQTVTVTGVNDNVDRNDTTTITLGIVDASSDDTYDPVGNQSVSVTCTDDDTAGYTVTQSGGTTVVAENGGTDSFTVRLNSEPVSNVVINVASSSSADATVSVTSLTFTPANWSIDQTVTATGVNDDIDRNDTAIVTLSINAANSDNAFDLLANQTVTVTCTDDDVAGIAVVQSGGTTVVAENAGTDTFTVALSSQPLGDVVIGVVSTITADATVSPASLTFTSANWSTPQTVTVTGVNDNIDRNDSSTVTLLTDDVATIDPAYDPLSGATVTVTCTDDDTAGINVAESGGSTVVAENAGTDTFTVSLNSEPTGTVVVSVVSGSAADATVSPTSLTFTALDWSTPQTVTVTGVNDNYDRDDAATITITTTDSTTLDATYDPVAGPNVTTTCTDDDTAGFIIGAISGNTTEAPGTATFTVRLTAQPTANVVIPFSSSDITEGTVTATPLTFTNATNNWSTNQTMTVTGVDDSIVDGNIAYTIVSAAATSTDPAFNGLDPADVAVTNNDNDKPTVAVTATDATATEADLTTGVFTFTRSADIVRNAVTVFYTVSGTASAFVDYQTLYGSVVIPAGQDTATVPLIPLDDGVSEVAETVIVTLTANAAYTIGGVAATASIQDDEPVAVTMVASDNAASEPGRTEGNGVFTFTRTGDNSADLTVNYSIGGTATNGADYTSLTGAVTILAGQNTATVTVAPINDTEQEFNETVILNVAPGTGYVVGYYAANAITVTIYEDEAPVVTVTASDADARELAAAATGIYTITRTGSTLSAITVNYAMSGTATNGTDYSNLAGTVSIGANSSSATVTLTPTDDALSEGDETAILTLGSGSGYTVGTPNAAAITIGDGELPIISFGSSDLDAAEPSGNNGSFVIARAGATTAVTVNYTISGTATSGSDFTAVSGSVSFPAGGTSQTVTIAVLDDLLAENPETVILTLTPNAAYSITGPTSQTLTIRDDENKVILSATDTSATEGGDTGTFRFTKSIAAGAMTVNYTIGGTGAVNGTDYAALSGNITIPDGQTFADLTITANADFIYDPAETVTVTLAANGTAYSIGTAAAQTVTITDATGKPTIKLIAPDSAAIESPLTAGFYSLQLSHQAAANTAVTYTVSGTATPTTDYTALSGSVTVNAGVLDQKITLTPVADGLVETSETVILALNAGAAYNIGTPAAATAFILDSDTAGFTIAETAGNTTVAENAGTDTFAVALNTQPNSNVVITVTSGSTADATVGPATLTFTPANWHIPQTVTVTGVNDNLTTNDSATIALGIDDANSDNAYDPVADQSVTVSCADDDTFATWVNGNFADGTLASKGMALDPDGDGLANGVEWVIGGDPTLASDATSKKPAFDLTTDPTYFTFRFRRTDAAKADPKTSIVVEYSNSLGIWTTAVDDLGDNVDIVEANDAYGSGVDKVEVKIKRSVAAPSGKLFGRLKVVVTP